jgi:exodeoxyribonuclease V alpha subunit
VSDIVAKLKKIIWRSLDNDFTIAAFIPTDQLPEFTATGDLFHPAEGVTYSLSGEWIDTPKYGRQFKIENYCVQAPDDVSGIAVYLEKYVNGIGPILADKLVDLYGKHTIRLLKKTPERISNENKGISYKLACSISDQLQEDDKRQEILIKLEDLFSKVKGLPLNLAQNVIALYGLSAYEVIKNNPYALVDMARIGFVLADKVALACGVKADDAKRIKYGLLYIVKQMIQESGDIWLKPNVITENLFSLVAGVKADNINSMLVKLVKDKIFVKCNKHVTLAKFAADEDIIADCVGRFII